MCSHKQRQSRYLVRRTLVASVVGGCGVVLMPSVEATANPARCKFNQPLGLAPPMPACRRCGSWQQSRIGLRLAVHHAADTDRAGVGGGGRLSVDPRHRDHDGSVVRFVLQPDVSPKAGPDGRTGALDDRGRVGVVVLRDIQPAWAGRPSASPVRWWARTSLRRRLCGTRTPA